MTQSPPPLSFAQEQLWFIDEFHHGLPAHNLAWQVRLDGPLDTGALARAVDRVRARHEALEEKFPTCALAILDFDVGRWRDITPGAGKLKDFVRPKDL